MEGRQVSYELKDSTDPVYVQIGHRMVPVLSVMSIHGRTVLMTEPLDGC